MRLDYVLLRSLELRQHPKRALGVFAITFLAIITAAGGSIIRDAIIHELPSILHEGLYATPAALIGLLYGIFGSLRHNEIFVVAILAGSYLLRLSSIYWRTGMWRPSDTPAIVPDIELDPVDS